MGEKATGVGRPVAIRTIRIADGFRASQFRQMLVLDASSGQAFAEGAFRKTFLSRKRQFTDISDALNPSFKQTSDECVDINAFVAERE